jgi:hypothetical protein
LPGFFIHLLVYSILSAALLIVGERAGFVDVSGIPGLLPAFFLGLVYAIFPDLDAPSSKIRKFVSRILLLLLLVMLAGYVAGILDTMAIYASIIVAGVLLFLWSVRHRGPFHSIFFALLFSLPLLLLGRTYAIFALFGYLSHLLLDGKLFK